MRPTTSEPECATKPSRCAWHRRDSASTATPPAGEAAARLDALIGPVVYRLSVSDLAGGFLSAYEIVSVPVELDLDERSHYETSLGIFQDTHRAFMARHPGTSWIDFVRAGGFRRAGTSGLGRLATR